MKIKNIWKDVEEPLELHTDDRGSIVDVFYNDDIEHVAVINTKPIIKTKCKTNYKTNYKIELQNQLQNQSQNQLQNQLQTNY